MMGVGKTKVGSPTALTLFVIMRGERYLTVDREYHVSADLTMYFTPDHITSLFIEKYSEFYCVNCQDASLSTSPRQCKIKSALLYPPMVLRAALSYGDLIPRI